MRFGLKQLVTPCAILAVALLAACGSSESVQEELDTQRLTDLEALEQEKADLDVLRQQRADAQAQIDDPETIETPEGGEAPTVEDLQIEVDKLDLEIEAATDALSKKVVEYINADPPVANGELSETQRRAAALKINEDILVARDWIEKGGDYRRALSILEGLIPLDPQNQELRDEIASAKDMRFVTQERFDQIKKGQSDEEVKAILGPVNLRNLREYPERNAIAWFYPKQDGGAAAVYFRKRGDSYKVYQTDFSAVEQKVVESGADGG